MLFPERMILSETALVIFILFGVVHYSHLSLTFTSDKYKYLSGSQLVLRLNTSFPVTIDRKQYKDLWVYRNGFVTLGAALEEETYPILTGSGTMTYQPFENLFGENIIAMFVTVNKDVEGQVRIKEFYIRSLKGSTKKNLHDFENIISKEYGESMLRSIEHGVVVEWTDMEMEGKGKHLKNSFRLYILSSDIQSFVIFHYWNIQSVSYELFDQVFLYQAGIRSYANRNFVLPFFNIYERRNDLKEWSNIGRDNTWLMNLGDLSYNIDLGLPRIKSQVPLRLKKTKIMLQNDKFYEDENKSSKDNKEAAFKESKPLLFTEASEKEENQQKCKASLFTHDDIQSTKRVTLYQKKSSSYQSLVKEISPKTASRRDEHITKLDRFNNGMTVSSEVLEASSEGSRKQSTARVIPFNLPPKKGLYASKRVHLATLETSQTRPNLRDYYIETKKLLLKGIGFENSSKDVKQCSSNSCGLNQHCFIYEANSCCVCLPETMHVGDHCVRKESKLKTRSFGSVYIPQEYGPVILDVAIVISMNDHFPTTNITFQSNIYMEEKLRNFILALYPIFHIPMAFYASSWKQQQVPNLSELVGRVVGINTFIEINGYGDLYATFKLNRTTEDHWTISVSSFDVSRLDIFSVNGLRFDEKSKMPSYVKYVLTQKNSIDFDEQSVHFSDENKNLTVKVKWRGSMTFAGSCLSNLIKNKEYFVKFADNGYCNTDCTGAEDNNCRMMCLGYPFVFENIPDICEGTLCPRPKVCVVHDYGYDCQCPPNLTSNGDSCIDLTTSSTSPITSLTPKTYPSCTDCSVFSSCKTLNSQTCCLCNTGYVGSGITCFPQESQFEINSFGSLTFLGDNAELTTNMELRLLARRWHRDNKVNYATLVEVANVLYSTPREQENLHFILSLSPIFDIPMSLFAMDNTNNFDTSIYALSKGSLKLTIKVSGIFSTPIFILLSISERKDYIETNMKLKDLPLHLNMTTWITSQMLFENRQSPEIQYKVKGNRIFLLPYSIQPFGPLDNKVWMISGSGELGDCQNQENDERLIIVSMGQSLYCNPRFKNQSYQPYCQAIPQLHVVQRDTTCSLPCHQKAKCIRSICVCPPGFSGDGLACEGIKKTLECSKSSECIQHPLFECKEGRCICRSGTMLQDNQCVLLKTCQSCSFKEHCEDNKCVCDTKYIRNRVSNQCIFDCSLCDVYSTTCAQDTCSCKSSFVYDADSNTSCVLQCHSDSDCPEHEFCSHMKKCICPTKKVAGLCQEVSRCNTCNKNAVCLNNECVCKSDWIGNGVDCLYNCSLCFNKQYCNLSAGCSCPPNFIGDGKKCSEVTCSTCPDNASCKRVGLKYLCECNIGMIKSEGKCFQDIVQMVIMPSNNILVVEGSTVELFCFAESKTNTFNVTWTRRSGKLIRGKQYFLNERNISLQLTITRMNLDDNDYYICTASSGESKTILIKSVSAPKTSKVLSRTTSSTFKYEYFKSTTFSSETFHHVTFTPTTIISKTFKPSTLTSATFTPSTTTPDPCLSSCHKYATCISGKCTCNVKYIGNGTNCIERILCPSNCSENMICQEHLGQCHCRPGFIEKNLKCFHDCRVQPSCDMNALCNTSSGRCHCKPGFVGNGAKCWKTRISCLLTKKCGLRASCVKIDDFLQHGCVCDKGFIGDGFKCFKKMTCGRDSCGPYSFCEPTIIKDHYGNLQMNGRCSCEPGFSKVKGKCEDSLAMNKTLWMTMGEAIISLGINENKSRIRYIDTSSDGKAQYGVILALTGDCSSKRLYWSSQKGRVIRSSLINNMARTTDHMSDLGKVTGLTVEEITGNLYFTDTYKGKITVLDPVKNLSKTIIHIKDYHPGQIVSHSSSGILFWTVTDLNNPRIEMSRMTGSQRKEFVRLKKQPISLAIVYNDKSNDSLCWMELNDPNINEKTVKKPLVYGFIRCANISDKYPPIIYDLHEVATEEPSAGFTFAEKFYWGVRNGKFLRIFGDTLTKIPIIPNCCDISVRSILVLPEQCRKDKSNFNPCFSKHRHVCKEICVLKIIPNGNMRPTCIKSDG